MIYNIAIDGPAGAGKTTIAKKGCRRAFLCVCRYRRHVQGNGSLPSSPECKQRKPDEIGEACQGAEISIEYKNGEQIVLLNGENGIRFSGKKR